MKYSQTHRHGLAPPKYKGGASALLQAVFYVMVFVSQDTCSTFIFLKDRKK
jgi:hypothetical protein